MASSRDAEERSEDGNASLPDWGDSIDTMTFEQILEMDDDDEEREFSRSIVYGFFDQAESTFTKMGICLARGDLSELSSLGHFLKGSSATLGLTKVKDSCEKIQHFGAHKDETGTHEEPNDQVCLDRVRETLEIVKVEYAEIKRKLKHYYHDPSPS